jgi:hypothetical protein
MPLHIDKTYQMGTGFGVVGSVRLVMYLIFNHLLLIPTYPFNNWFVRLITYIFIYLSIHLLTCFFGCIFLYYLPLPMFVYLFTFFINLCTLLLFILFIVCLFVLSIYCYSFINTLIKDSQLLRYNATSLDDSPSS